MKTSTTAAAARHGCTCLPPWHWGPESGNHWSVTMLHFLEVYTCELKLCSLLHLISWLCIIILKNIHIVACISSSSLCIEGWGIVSGTVLSWLWMPPSSSSNKSYLLFSQFLLQDMLLLASPLDWLADTGFVSLQVPAILNKASMNINRCTGICINSCSYYPRPYMLWEEWWVTWQVLLWLGYVCLIMVHMAESWPSVSQHRGDMGTLRDRAWWEVLGSMGHSHQKELKELWWVPVSVEMRF